MFKAGDQIGPYAIVRNLGAGAMGEVYLGHHRHMGRDAAIKVLRTELTEDPDVVNRFFTEARATAAARHPGIVEIFDCDIHRTGRAFIVMEYLRGEDLARRLERAGDAGLAGDLPGALAIARQIADALGAAHALGIVHRDLKPGNIFLVGAEGDASPHVKIVDFGIAKLLRPDGGHDQTQTGRILGTPLYMSPEQARGAKTIDQRTDVYALGCVLFEMLAGRPVFERKGPAQVIVAHLHEPAPTLASVVPGVPAPLDALVAAMLAKAPEHRPATMSEVIVRLDAAAVTLAPSHVATQVLPGGRPAGGRLTPEPAAPLATAAPKPAESGPTAKVAMGKPVVAPAPAAAGAPPAGARPQVQTARREAKVFARAASTTLGSSAAEILTTIEDVPATRSRGRALAFGGAAVVLLGGAVTWQLTRAGSHAPVPEVASAAVAPAPAPVEPAPAAVPVVAASTQVEIELASQPIGAEVWVGDETSARGRTPLKVALAADAAPTRAVLRAEGHDDASIVLDPRDGKPQNVVLSPRAAAPAPAHHHGGAKHDKGGFRAPAAEGGFKAIED